MEVFGELDDLKVNFETPWVRETKKPVLPSKGNIPSEELPEMPEPTERFCQEVDEANALAGSALSHPECATATLCMEGFGKLPDLKVNFETPWVRKTRRSVQPLNANLPPEELPKMPEPTERFCQEVDIAKALASKVAMAQGYMLQPQKRNRRRISTKKKNAYSAFAAVYGQELISLPAHKKNGIISRVWREETRKYWWKTYARLYNSQIRTESFKDWFIRNYHTSDNEHPFKSSRSK